VIDRRYLLTTELPAINGSFTGIGRCSPYFLHPTLTRLTRIVLPPSCCSATPDLLHGANGSRLTSIGTGRDLHCIQHSDRHTPPLDQPPWRECVKVMGPSVPGSAHAGGLTVSTPPTLTTFECLLIEPASSVTLVFEESILGLLPQAALLLLAPIRVATLQRRRAKVAKSSHLGFLKSVLPDCYDSAA
jgi:hypothetical protein